MLLCLNTGQRGQTLHKFDVNCILEMGKVLHHWSVNVHLKIEIEGKVLKNV